jgi:hypothetical protein
MDMNTKHIILVISAFSAGWFGRNFFDKKSIVAVAPEYIPAPVPVEVPEAAPLPVSDNLDIPSSVKPEVLVTKGQKAEPFDEVAFKALIAPLAR